MKSQRESLEKAIVESIYELSEFCQRDITREHVLYALVMCLGDPWEIRSPVEIWNVSTSKEEIVLALSNFDFDTFDREITVEFDVSEFMDSSSINHRRVGVKWNNSLWRIHKNDADPFPSTPHAHQMDQNVKLDLSTGALYQLREKVGKLRKKQLLEIRSRFEAKGVELPPMLI